jgi:DMSO reductase family type II enzyme heme b subunit
MKRAGIVVCASMLMTSAAFLGGCARQAEHVPEVVALQVSKLPSEPSDPAWRGAPEHVARLILQDLVEPRLMKTSTPEVRVRALANGSEIAFRLEWADQDRNDTPGPAKFVDACAIQLPEKQEQEPPAPQMGEHGKSVQVTYWRADWQAIVNGRGDSIRDLYPNAAVDHYPFEAKPLEQGSAEQREFAARYGPARALGNDRGGPRERPVEDLLATGPGTLTPGPSLGSAGKGEHRSASWQVVISRKLPQGLGPQQRTQIAFAVWQGSQKETGAKKMRSGWIPLLVRGQL